MPFAAMRFLAVLLLVLAAIQAPAISAGAREETRMDRRPGLESELVRALNRARAEHGLRPLRATPGLRSAARSHSRSMLNTGFFGHASPDGTPFGDRIRRFYTNHGWRTWSVGETLLATEGRETTAASVVSAWLDSPPHRRVVLSPVFRDVGIGAFYTASAPGEYGGISAVVVTADFGLRAGRA